MKNTYLYENNKIIKKDYSLVICEKPEAARKIAEAFSNNTYRTLKVTASIVFNLIQNRIKSGTIIVFDNYFGQPGWEINDFKAFREFVLKNEIKYYYFGFSLTTVAVCIN